MPRCLVHGGPELRCTRDHFSWEADGMIGKQKPCQDKIINQIIFSINLRSNFRQTRELRRFGLSIVWRRFQRRLMGLHMMIICWCQHLGAEMDSWEDLDVDHCIRPQSIPNVKFGEIRVVGSKWEIDQEPWNWKKQWSSQNRSIDARNIRWKGVGFIHRRNPFPHRDKAGLLFHLNTF